MKRARTAVPGTRARTARALRTCAAGSAGDAGTAAADDAAARAAAAAAAGAAWHVEVRNLAWHPAMEWSDGGPVRVRFLADMDEATTNANVRAQELNYGQPSMEGVNLYAYVREKTDATVTEIPVVW